MPDLHWRTIADFINSSSYRTVRWQVVSLKGSWTSWRHQSVYFMMRCCEVIEKFASWIKRANDERVKIKSHSYFSLIWRCNPTRLPLLAVIDMEYCMIPTCYSLACQDIQNNKVNKNNSPISTSERVIDKPYGDTWNDLWSQALWPRNTQLSGVLSAYYAIHTGMLHARMIE